MFKNKTSIEDFESHPLYPSGQWEGFYCYHIHSKQHKMKMDLEFTSLIISGSGVDDVAPFTWKGKYSIEPYKANFNKIYSTHSVIYTGDVDENGIWGLWELAYDWSKFPASILPQLKEATKNEMTGGFHIWPSKNANNNYASSEKEESQKLSEIFIKEFTYS